MRINLTYLASGLGHIIKWFIDDDGLAYSSYVTNAALATSRPRYTCNNHIEAPEIEGAIIQAVSSLFKGVRVLAGPTGLGKSTAVHRAAETLRLKGIINGYIVVSGRELDPNQPSLRQLSQYWGARWDGPLSDLFQSTIEKPVLLVVDQCENMYTNEKIYAKTDNLFKMIAEDSSLTEKYITLAVSSSLPVANRICAANGRQKIMPMTSQPSTLRWPRERLQALLVSHEADSTKSADLRALPEPYKQQLLDASTLVATPGFLVRHLESLREAGTDGIRAIRLSRVWEEARHQAQLWNKFDDDLDPVLSVEDM